MALVRVFELPSGLAVGYLFGGGRPAIFKEVDWFQDDPAIEGAPSFATAEGRATIEEFIRQKRYFDPNRSYLVMHEEHPMMINYAAPR